MKLPRSLQVSLCLSSLILANVENTAKAIPGFEKFLIPAIAVIAFFWAVNITMSFLKAYVADASFSSSFSYFYLAFVAFFDAIILTVSIWGGVRLLLSLRGANSSSVLMFIILEFVAVAIIVGLSLAFCRFFFYTKFCF